MCVCVCVRVRKCVPCYPPPPPTDRPAAPQLEPDRRRRRDGARLQPAGPQRPHFVFHVSVPLRSDGVCMRARARSIWRRFVWGRFWGALTLGARAAMYRQGEPAQRRRQGRIAGGAPAGQHHLLPVNCGYAATYAPARRRRGGAPAASIAGMEPRPPLLPRHRRRPPLNDVGDICGCGAGLANGGGDDGPV